jgi:hypothetical protein
MTSRRTISNRGDVVMLGRVPSEQMDAPVLVWWPDEVEKLAELRDARRPRLIVVQEGAEPPISGDPLEDWVRASDTASLPDRVATLMARAGLITYAPSLDPGGVLRVGSQWTLLSEYDVEMARPLVDAFGSVVAYADMVGDVVAGREASGTASAVLRRRVARLRNRVRRVGLDVRVVRNRGYVLLRDLGAGVATASLV